MPSITYKRKGVRHFFPKVEYNYLGFTHYFMNNNVKKLLDIAYNEVGYLEKQSDTGLDDKVANAGSNNFTKYARDSFPELQGYAWCCMFVWWCFEKAFGKIMARNLVGEKTAKCSTMKDRMLMNGCQNVSNPHEGDIIFFDSGSGINHTGIVYSTGYSYFSTIEGNTSRGTDEVIANGGGVFIRAYNYGNYRIDSFIRPRWDLIKDSYDIAEPIIKYNAEINAYNVNIRDGAGTQNKRVGLETKGFMFNIIGEKIDSNGHKWYTFIYKGKTAYICADYVRRLGN